MALVECRECRARVSESAPSCPHCGILEPGIGGGYREPVPQPQPVADAAPLRPLPRGPRRAARLRVGQAVYVHSPTLQTTGIIREISEDWGRGGGTKVYPAFLVEIADEQFR